MIITSVPVYLFTIFQQCEQIKKNIQHLPYKTMSVGLMHGRPDNPRFSHFSFAFELSLILIRMFSNAEDQSSFICRQHDTFFLTWIWKISLFSTFCDIYTLSKKRLMKICINHMLFVLAFNERKLNCRSVFAFTYIHLSTIFHSLFHSDNACFQPH